MHGRAKAVEELYNPPEYFICALSLEIFGKDFQAERSSGKFQVETLLREQRRPKPLELSYWSHSGEATLAKALQGGKV